ncbi:MAG: GNAT family N-acetyltransferase [Clostridium sp.]|nr:GNAT family N-acetyltransferase [Clostridium sp.]
MVILKYDEKYKKQIIDLILDIQNNEAKISLSLEEQPDLKNIHNYYEKNGGEFWIAVENDEVIGTIALMNKGNGNSVLKKFFVRKDWRSKRIGLALYENLLSFAHQNNIKNILLDTPSVATASHRFYEKSGFERINKEQVPFDYDYPDRKSYLYLLKL